MYDLSIVLGARFYVREGEFGIFQKHVRDLPVLSLGHAGTAACQATIIPQLPRLARRSWFPAEPAPAGLFRARERLPPPSLDGLVLAARTDALSATLVAAVDDCPAASTREHAAHGLARAARRGSCADSQESCSCLARGPHRAGAARETFALADRYALLLAAAAVLGVWQQAAATTTPSSPTPAWAAAALHRLVRRLGQPPPDLPDGCEDRVHDEVLRRFERAAAATTCTTPRSPADRRPGRSRIPVRSPVTTDRLPIPAEEFAMPAPTTVPPPRHFRAG